MKKILTILAVLICLISCNKEVPATVEVRSTIYLKVDAIANDGSVNSTNIIMLK